MFLLLNEFKILYYSVDRLKEKNLYMCAKSHSTFLLIYSIIGYPTTIRAITIYA